MPIELVYADKSNISTPVELSKKVSATFAQEIAQTYNESASGGDFITDFGVARHIIDLEVPYGSLDDIHNFNNFISNSKVNYMQKWFLIKLDCSWYGNNFVPTASWYATYDTSGAGTALAAGDSVDYDASTNERAVITYNQEILQYIRLKPTDYNYLPVDNDVITKVGAATSSVTLNMDGYYYPVRLAENTLTEQIKNVGNRSVKIKLRVVTPEYEDREIG
jgi:hypothetical protein